MTTYLRIPLYILQAILPLGVTVTFLELLFSTASIIRKKDVPRNKLETPSIKSCEMELGEYEY
jgi:TRAP-type C4-dicarboxylate transport system permease small subunit